MLETFIAALTENERYERRAPTPILLTLELRCNLLPSVVLLEITNEYHFDASFYLSMCRARASNCYFSMDMPNLIEHWRVLYSAENGRPLSVLWNVETEDAYIDAKRDVLEEKDWEILKEGQCEKVWPWDDYLSEAEQHPPTRFVQWTLKRNKLTGPLIAADPVAYRYRQ
jgi:hypothetical protein